MEEKLGYRVTRNEKVTFTKAAEIANLSLWEFADLVKQRNIEWVDNSLEDIELEIKNILSKFIMKSIIFDSR